jgi:integrin alpha FG-GAP repeat containing protein 1
MGLEDADGQVAAFGDLNGDSAMDLFVVNGDATRVNVYLWNHDSFSFLVSSISEIVVPNGRQIVNIIPADFTYDGKLDLLVMMQGRGRQETEMMLWLGKAGGAFGE